MLFNNFYSYLCFEKKVEMAEKKLKTLEYLLTESGFKHTKIIKELGIGTSYYHKLRKSPENFTLHQIILLSQILRVPFEELCTILKNQVEQNTRNENP